MVNNSIELFPLPGTLRCRGEKLRCNAKCNRRVSNSRSQKQMKSGFSYSPSRSLHFTATRLRQTGTGGAAPALLPHARGSAVRTLLVALRALEQLRAQPLSRTPQRNSVAGCRVDSRWNGRTRTAARCSSNARRSQLASIANLGESPPLYTCYVHGSVQKMADLAIDIVLPYYNLTIITFCFSTS